jgi:hypothetical protein
MSRHTKRLLAAAAVVLAAACSDEREPVTTSDQPDLLGILWGGSGSSSFVFSPLSNIEGELGALTTF